MAKSKLPTALRKHIRVIKARMKREGLSVEERRKKIAEFTALYKKSTASSAPASSAKPADKKGKSVDKIKQAKNKPARKVVDSGRNK